MNNRGQSLVSFIFVVPIILLILFMVYDIGSMVLLREKLDNIGYLAINYGLDNIDKENLNDKITDMIEKNKSDIEDVSVSINDGEISVSLQDKLENRLSLINKFDSLDIKVSYIGYLEEDKKIIRKDK